MSKRILGMFIAVLLIAAMIIPTAVGELRTMYVKTNSGVGLHVRSTPEVRKNNVLGSIRYGGSVLVDHFMSNGWAVIVYNSRTAYVASRYLVSTKPSGKVTPTPTPSSSALDAMNAEFKSAQKVTPYAVIVNPERVTSWVNLRWAPSTSARSLTTYRAGTQLTVIAKTNHWSQVQDAQGNVGFVYTAYTATVYGTAAQ